MLQTWWFWMIAYWITYIIYVQFYKVVTQKSKNDGALTILLQLLSGVFILVLIPFFKIQFSTNAMTYLFLGLACIFYAITDRLNTTVYRGLEVSVYSILGQLSTVFMIAWGVLFFKEEIIAKKIIGAIFILIGNVMVLYKKGKFEWNKYILYSLLANLSMSIGISIDVGISNQFNLPIYAAITLILPAFFIIIMQRIKLKEMSREWKEGNKKAIIIVCCTWGLTIITMLRTYQLGNITTVAPLCAVTTILNILISYFLQKEKDHFIKKIIAGFIVLAGMWFVNM